MDITMFFEFPGILITIGVILLIISIILLIIAFKTNDDSIIEATESNLNNAPIVNNNVNNAPEQPVEEKNQEKDADDGFNLTKVFEISPNNGIQEKEIKSNREELDPLTNKTIEIKNEDTNQSEEDEIELL